MQKNDIAEIRKNIKLNNDFLTIENVYSALIWNNKEIKHFSHSLFFNKNLFEQEYIINIAKKSLAGKFGKNTIHYDFENNWNINEENGASQLYDFATGSFEKYKVLKFVNDIANNFETSEPYLLNLISCTYDIPIKKGKKMVPSGELFHFIVCSFVNMKHLKSNMIYNEQTETFEVKSYLDITFKDSPFMGITYPLFTDREKDVNGLLYYIDNSTEPAFDLLQDFFCCKTDSSPKQQLSKFNTVLLQTFGEDMNFDTVTNIKEHMRLKIKENEKDINGSGKHTSISKNEFINIVKQSTELNEETLNLLKDSFDENFGEKNSLMAEAVIDDKKVVAKTEKIKINADSKTLKEHMYTDIINGQKCLIINIEEGIEIDGLEVSL